MCMKLHDIYDIYNICDTYDVYDKYEMYDAYDNYNIYSDVWFWRYRALMAEEDNSTSPFRF